MGLLDDLKSEVRGVFATRWNQRAGNVVPSTEQIALGNDAVTLDATVLYADLVDSTGLVNGYKAHFAAEVYKAFLLTACRIIRSEGADITAFDGDRVMAVFIGGNKNSDAARTALKLNWAMQHVVAPSMRARYSTVSFAPQHRVGIDTSDVFVARTGIRGSNDLVWVGRAANYAAKLSALSEFGPSVITEDVFARLNDAAKYGGMPRQPMWERVIWREMGIAVYRSSWTWAIQ